MEYRSGGIETKNKYFQYYEKNIDTKNFCCREISLHSTSLKTFTKEIRYFIKNYTR